MFLVITKQRNIRLGLKQTRKYMREILSLFL